MSIARGNEGTEEMRRLWLRIWFFSRRLSGFSANINPLGISQKLKEACPD